MTEHLARLIEDQPEPNPFAHLGAAAGIDVCVRCGGRVHRAAPDTDPDAAVWYHNEVADDVFCGLVMHAADRLGR